MKKQLIFLVILSLFSFGTTYWGLSTSGPCNTCPWFSIQSIELVLIPLVVLFSLLSTYLSYNCKFIKKNKKLHTHIFYLILFFMYYIITYSLLNTIILIFTYL